ncbi:MAG: bacteriochlorophyll 4-vinyl reductase [Devosiaceae bacterium]
MPPRLTSQKTQSRTSGEIGPNAILQVIAVLEGTFSRAKVQKIMDQAGLCHYLRTPPETMVDEWEVVRLHQAVRVQLTPNDAMQVLDEAGVQTADYILANRIPKIAQMVLKRLPARLASPPLLKAIARHAWTFAGSGVFTYASGQSTHITLADCPACEEVYAANERCAYYIATMQGLFQALVHPAARITQCPPASTDRCVRTFALEWP